MAKKGKRRPKTPKPGAALKQVIDPRIAKALAHPLRSHILATLGERLASPKEIGEAIGMDARDLNYHFRVLTDLEMIKLATTEKRRGATEHFYELCLPSICFDDDEWMKIPQPIRSGISASLFQTVVDEVARALRAGTFDAEICHQSRTPAILDAQGLADARDATEAALARLLEICRESEERRRRGSPGTPVQIFMLLFGMPNGATDEVPASGGVAGA